MTIRILFLAIFLVGSACAQPAIEPAAPLVVMNLAAHPDDEDGRTLAYYRHAKNAVAYSVIFTRGEGGQNEIGPELYADLGALRTVETEKAARILGTQVFFLNYEDFGYSKSAAEAYERWGGEDAVTARLVYLIRKLKPDVLFTNHDTTTVGDRLQHGHHQAVGVAAYRAFELAADPSYHSEQLSEEGVYLWQPSRLFLRSWTQPEHFDARVPVGEFDPKTGESYATRAMRSLSEHASQGMDFFVGGGRRGAGEATWFTLYRSVVPLTADSLDLAAGLPANTEARPDLSYMIDSGRLPVIPEDLVGTDTRFIVPGGTFNVSWQDSLLPVGSSLTWEFFGPEGLRASHPVKSDNLYVGTVSVGNEVVPSWPRQEYQYKHFRSRPPFYYAVRDAKSGNIVAGGYIPVHIAPKVTVRPPAEVILIRPGKNEIEVTGHVYDRVTKCVYLAVSVFELGAASPIRESVVTQEVNGDGSFSATVALELPEDLPAGDYQFGIEARLGKVHQTAIQGLARAFDTKVASGLGVGVVESYDGSLGEAVRVLGIDPVLLDSAALSEGDFGDLHTILVDIRGYFVRPDLRKHNDNLLAWVRSGGHLIVNYQKTFEWNPQSTDPFDSALNNPPDFAPYPLVLGRGRVTREDAPVRLLQPEHVLFAYPNQISQSDWDGWVQERGLYFPDAYDQNYTELFAIADPGESERTGSTLLAEYGQGTYLYTALGWYRQLKRYHPGAFKMFANMLSLPLAE